LACRNQIQAAKINLGTMPIGPWAVNDGAEPSLIGLNNGG
jgi:hypothetical protein